MPPPTDPENTARQNLRVLAIFLIGISVGVCLTLLYIDTFKPLFRRLEIIERAAPRPGR